MFRSVHLWMLAFLVLSTTAIWCAMAAGPEDSLDDHRASARKDFTDGNYRDALTTYQKLVRDGRNAGPQLAEDLQQAWLSLGQLQRLHEQDALLNEAIESHPEDPFVYWKAARLLHQSQHAGFVVAGVFQRGDQRGGGQYVQSFERDRVQSLRWINRALELKQDQIQNGDLGDFWAHAAEILLAFRESQQAWRLQALTDLSDLPDYEPGHRWGGGENKGAAVGADGQPVFHKIPQSWAEAQSDGERWRFALEQYAAIHPANRRLADERFADFLHGQFGVQTLQQWGIVLPRADETEGATDDPATSLVSLKSLTDDETVARLANGVKRFKLPDEFNYIRIYRQLAEQDHGEQPYNRLIQIYENRQQYETAAEWCRKDIAKFGADIGRQQRLDQIVKNWGQFEPVMTQPAGQGATVEYRFRNGQVVNFEAHVLKVPELLNDIKAYLKSNPKELDWQRLQIDNLGYRIVEENQKKYVGAQVASWSLNVEPRAGHFDRRITVTTPLQKAGAYLVTAKMKDGNTSRIILWLDDTVIVKKQLNNKVLYYVADAVTGKPIEKANVEFFGWRNEHVPNSPRDYRTITQNFAEFSDAEGLIVLPPDRQEQNFQWLLTARTNAGRFAHLGFTGVWYGRYQQQQFQQSKVFVVTDRPVYRPDQQVQFKFWAGTAKYDASDENPWAGKSFAITIHDPQGTEISKQELVADQYGGFAGEFQLPQDAKLGNYSLSASLPGVLAGGGAFRVEEYKKPEFEVTIEAPETPVQLGEQVTAIIRSKYYFGAPVQNAKVKFKVERSAHETRWYPAMPWDWLYGNGYWWFAGDDFWYPGFAKWGCLAPRQHWIQWNPHPPELVLDQEVEIGDDGSVLVEIDTALAKALHGDEDHEYTITAEVTDSSRRTIVGTGKVLVAREPFKVFAWVDRGHYRLADSVHAHFQARTPDGRGVTGQGKLKLLKIRYDANGTPVEDVAQEWDLNPNEEGYAELQFKASAAGQYRLSYSVTTAAAEGARSIEGGYLFVIRGDGFDGADYQFSDLELITSKREYAPGEPVELLINTNRVGATVLLFVRPENGVYAGKPQVLRLAGKSNTVEIAVAQADMPNFFVEAVTIAGGKLHTVMREVIVPPEKRVLNVEVLPKETRYGPGANAEIQIKITDALGEPFVGSTAIAVYDRAVEYISGGSNVPEIKEFFWKWRRSHQPQTEHSLQRYFWQLLKSNEPSMQDLGVFGGMVADADDGLETLGGVGGAENRRLRKSNLDSRMSGGAPMPMAAPAMMEMNSAEGMAADFAGDKSGRGGSGGEDNLVQPTVRSNFADTAYWNGTLTTNAAGIATISFKMPESLTGWRIRAWGVGNGTRVGEGTSEVVTAKDLLVRLQAPRFFVERDEVVLSAIVHNYLPEAKAATVELKLAGGTLELMSDGADNPDLSTVVNVPAGGEIRVDWRCKAIAEGNAVVTMSALTDVESDAMQMTFPVLVHGFLKTESFSGVIRKGQNSGVIDITVPAERRPEQSQLEIRYSPTLAGAMVDALPYLTSYPYGCTEQTLNRFVPTVITQHILQSMNLDLAAIKEKRTNLNAQEIGNDAKRAERWQHWTHNPVFDETEVAAMVKQGVEDLTAMQNSDGGWGWFSGFGEQSYPHTTAVVVHGLQLAQANDVALVPGILDRGLVWLKNYQSEQVKQLKEWEFRQTLKDIALQERRLPYKAAAGDADALVFMILCEADQLDTEMQRFLFRDRLSLTLYSQSLVGLAMHEIGAIEQRDQIMQNISQFVTVDEENQTAFIDLPNNAGWWYWHGNTIEANAFYLKLLTRVNPDDTRAAGLVKYLLNNRRHSTYWNNTRDTAYCIEALAEYLAASGEVQPNMLVELYVDGDLKQSVEITPEVLFNFDNTFVLAGDAVTTGPHKIELRTKPLNEGATAAPLYFNAYLTNFSTEEFITSAGLEMKVQRKFYKLVQRDDAKNTVQGAQGQVIDQQALKFDRIELPNLAQVVSGDLIEIELEIDSKNDYEYVIFEDFKAAGCEPVDLRSGYIRSGLGAYVEFRDEKVAFFLRTLARGKHSVSYRLRAEVPGTFSALPTSGYAMYAEELKANSDEMKLRITSGD